MNDDRKLLHVVPNMLVNGALGVCSLVVRIPHCRCGDLGTNLENYNQYKLYI